jgi:hypothetical protein
MFLGSLQKSHRPHWMQAPTTLRQKSLTTVKLCSSESISPSMKQLIYTSALQPRLNGSSLRAMLNIARSRNAAEGLSGILLQHSGSLLQVIEGPDPHVSSTFGRILHDPRHSAVNILSVKEVDAPEFGNSPMAYFDKNQHQPIPSGPMAELQLRPLLSLNESGARQLLLNLKLLTTPEPVDNGSLLQFIPHKRPSSFAVTPFPTLEPLAAQGIM